jgi:hypothetical protein
VRAGNPPRASNWFGRCASGFPPGDRSWSRM